MFVYDLRDVLLVLLVLGLAALWAVEWVFLKIAGRKSK